MAADEERRRFEQEARLASALNTVNFELEAIGSSDCSTWRKVRLPDHLIKHGIVQLRIFPVGPCGSAGKLHVAHVIGKLDRLSDGRVLGVERVAADENADGLLALLRPGFELTDATSNEAIARERNLQ